MRSHNEQNEIIDGPSYRELRLLSEIEREPETTQRELALKAKSALGMTNLLLRNLVQKGQIRVTQAGWKRWIYVMTPVGFARKIQLTVSYVQRVLHHYGEVRETLRKELALIALNSESRVAIYGAGEFAELVFLGLKELDVEEIDIYSPGDLKGTRFLGMPVRGLETFRPQDYDRVFVAYLGSIEGIVKDLESAGVPPEVLITFFNPGIPPE